MRQNSKKNAIFVAFLICKFKIKNVRISDIQKGNGYGNKF